MADPISVQNFSKSFGHTKVITDLSFDVKEGEVFAFLGANGSGKTTTIRSLLGIYKADTGTLLVNGQPYTAEQAAYLGYLPEERGLYVNSKVLETLLYFGQIKGMTYDDALKKSLEFLEKVELSDKVNVNIGKLSSGQQQKIQLGITVLNSPKLLILDEPTKGLDPVNRNLFLELFMDMNRHGTTIVFSTHQMEEAEKIADRLLMIKDGKKALYGDVREVKNTFGANNIQIEFNGKFPKNEAMYSGRVETHYAELTPVDSIKPTQILKYLVEQGVEVSRFEVTTPSLQEIFIKVTNEDVAN